ncbi:MAG TPA: ABC transporter permease [Fimbriimonas sp.]
MLSLSFALVVIVVTAPLILAAMGGYTSERGGVINIALEGKMLAAACLTAIVSHQVNAPAGVLAGIAAAIVLSLVLWLMTQHFFIDHVISGMAINALAAGGTNFLFGRYRQSDEIPQLPLAFYTVTAFVLPFALWLYAGRTRGGLRLISVGSDPEKSRLMGIEPIFVRMGGLVATGVFTGLAGAMLVTDTGRFSDNMTAGRGYIALAALIIGGWRPVPAFLACLLFGAFTALRIELVGSNVFGANLPSQFWSMLPYIVTIIALAGFLGRSRSPAGLGKH